MDMMWLSGWLLGLVLSLCYEIESIDWELFMIKDLGCMEGTRRVKSVTWKSLLRATFDVGLVVYV